MDFLTSANGQTVLNKKWVPVDRLKLVTWLIGAGFDEHPSRPDEYIRGHCSECGEGKAWRLMVNARTGFVKCWGCGQGWKNVYAWIATQDGITRADAIRLVGDTLQGIDIDASLDMGVAEALAEPTPTEFDPPPVSAVWYHGQELHGWHAEAAAKLAARGFGPEWMIAKGVGFGACDRYGGRVVLPVYQGGQFVWLQAWDWEKQSDIKYHSPKRAEGQAERRHLVYQLDMYRDAPCVAVMEGMFNSWAVEQAGLPAIATFGSSITDEQLALMLKTSIRRFILASDADAIYLAHESAGILTRHGREAVVVSYTDNRDANDLQLEERVALMQSAGDRDALLVRPTVKRTAERMARFQL